MTDLSTLSDSDLEALSKGDMSKVSDDGLAHLSKGPDIVARAANGIGSVLKFAGDTYDRFGPAPMRAALYNIGDSPLSAFIGQFGRDPRKAPTPTDLAQKMGFSNDKPIVDPKMAALLPPNPSPFSEDITPSDFAQGLSQVTPAQLAGVPIGIAADPFLLAGGVANAGKGVLRGIENGALLAKDTAGLVTKTSAKIADAAMGGSHLEGAVDTASKAANYVGGSVKNSYNAAVEHIFSPKQAPDFSELSGIATKNGIDPALLPESVEFGRGSFLDTAGRARREGPLGEQFKENFHNGLRQVQGALDKKISEVGNGTPMNALEAGAALRKGYNEGLAKFFDGIDMTHDEVLKYAPGLHVDRDSMESINSTVNGIEKFAKGRLERGITSEQRAQAQELMNAVSAIRSGNGSYKQTTEALRDIGQVAFGNIPGKQIPADTENLRKLYFALDDGLIQTVRKHVNPAFADELQANNQSMSAMFKNKEQVSSILSDPHIAPETAFQRTVMSGDSDQIQALRKILSPEAFDQQRAAFVNNLIKREADGTFNLQTLYSAMRNKEAQLRVLFEDKPQALLEMGELLKLGDRFGKAVLSTSGTGASNVFHHLSSSIKEGAMSDTLINSLKDRARNGAQAGAVAPLVPLNGAGYSPLSAAAKAAQVITGPAEGPSRVPSDDAVQRRLNNSRR